MYTAAGWINVILGVLNGVLFCPLIFKERPIAAKEAMFLSGADSGSKQFYLQIIYLILSTIKTCQKFLHIFNFTL